MHYVPKKKFARGLSGSAEDLAQEFYRAQEKLVELDQNNLGTSGGIYIPGSSATLNTGIARSAFPLPTSGTAEGSQDSLTRWHYATSASGVDVTTTDTWVDQTTAVINFKVYRTGPYMILGGAQLEEDGSVTPLTDDENPLRANMSVRLNGELLTPYVTVGYGVGSSASTIKAPMFFIGSRVLYPGDWTAMVSVNQSPGGSATVSNVDIGAVGFIR
tara:strand:+ start:19611 stop:20258 length:648 start_codon:yes stop_codon:yes gene_type:complete